MVIINDKSRLIYSEEYSKRNQVVMEIPEDLIADLFSNSVKVKFSRSGEAFLSNDYKCFSLRKVDNSNTQLFVKTRVDSTQDILYSAQSVAQVNPINVETIPDKDIAELFEQREGGSGEDILPYLCYNSVWPESLIIRHMRVLDNYFIEDGRWVRISDDEYYSLTDLLLGACAIIGVSPGSSDEFNTEDVWMSCNEAQEMDGKEQSLSMSKTQYLLSRLSDSESKSFKNKGEAEWPLKVQLCSEKVMFHRARQVLHGRLKGGRSNMNLEIFLKEWKKVLETTILIDACMVDEHALKDLVHEAIRDRAVIDQDLLIALDTRNLPLDINKRLDELFKVKSRWTKKHLEDLMLPVTPANVKVEAVLLKTTCRLENDDDDANSGNGFFYSSKF